MDLKDFKLVKNRQRPDFCYSYEKKEKGRKYSIFTMNGGKTFLASIEELGMDKKWYSEYSEKHDSAGKCLAAFDSFNGL